MPEAVVVGAGVFGTWTAWRLAAAGFRVRLLDAFGPGNGRASSTDHSRVLRAGYGRDAIYTHWAAQSRDDWVALGASASQPLFTVTGALFLGEPGNAYVRDSFETLSAAGLAAEWLEPPEIAARLPQLAVDGLGPALFERDAGVLRARAAVQALARLAVSTAGVELGIERLQPLDESAARPALRTQSGAAIRADVYVLACGPWLPQLLPAAVGPRVRPTRQEVLYFGIPPGDSRFSAPALPVWVDFAAGRYGIPDLDARGFKVGIDAHGPPIDPDRLDRVVSTAVVDSTREWMGRRFPGLADAPLVDSRVCQYENTSTGDFIIDRHPAWPDVWIVGGGSGHGFKHAPAVARHAVDRILGHAPPEPRFSLATKTDRAQRAVY